MILSIIDKMRLKVYENIKSKKIGTSIYRILKLLMLIYVLCGSILLMSTVIKNLKR